MGGDWALVNKRMIEILGESARSRVGRWIRAARHLHPELVVDLQAMPTLTDGTVFANPYLVSDKEKERLDLESARKALEIAVAAMQDGRPLSVPEFLKDVCAPLRAIQTWKAALFKKYGQLAENPATQRVIQFLRTSRGLKQVVLVLKENTPLHGESNENPGIQDCRSLVQELQKLKEKGTDTANSSLGADATDSTGQPRPTTAGQVGVDAMDLDLDAVRLDCVEEEVDPEEAALQQLAQKEFDCIHITLDASLFLQHLVGRLYASQRVIFLIDAPTSRVKVVSEYIDLVQQICSTTKLEKYIIAAA